AFWWALVLYFDAVVSPLGTAFIYITGSPRIIMAAGEMGNAPSHVTKLNRFGVPWVALVATYAVGVLFFFPFPSWQKLVSAVVSITVLSYSIGPIILLHLRSSMKDTARPFRLKAAKAVSFIAFVASNWIIYWTGDQVVSILFGLVVAYVVAYLLWHFIVKRGTAAALGWQHAWWLLPYFLGMFLISYYGPSANGMGGHDGFGFFTGMWIIVGFSAVILWLALKCGQGSEACREDAERIQVLASRGMEVHH
ncbi:MAG TPA: APC family permease, partial [Gammaproteobacteria bacterium]|nr:APC family permease [Gammaproteobacteria bacterium]